MKIETKIVLKDIKGRVSTSFDSVERARTSEGEIIIFRSEAAGKYVMMRVAAKHNVGRPGMKLEARVKKGTNEGETKAVLVPLADVRFAMAHDFKEFIKNYRKRHGRSAYKDYGLAPNENRVVFVALSVLREMSYFRRKSATPPDQNPEDEGTVALESEEGEAAETDEEDEDEDEDYVESEETPQDMPEEPPAPAPETAPFIAPLEPPASVQWQMFAQAHQQFWHAQAQAHYWRLHEMTQMWPKFAPTMPAPPLGPDCEMPPAKRQRSE